jgi:UDP-glucose 4-epimerase
MVVFGDGLQTRDFSFVEDTAKGIILAAMSDDAIGRTLNLGSGREITIHDLAIAVAAVTQRYPRIAYDAPRPGDVLRLCADVSQSRQILGFDPKVSLADGLTRLLEWYRAHDKSPEQLLEDEVIRNWDLEAAQRSSVIPS